MKEMISVNLDTCIFPYIVQSFSCVQLSVTAARQTSLSFTISQGLLKLMSIELVMPSKHLVLCRPLILLPSIFPSIRVFPNEWALRIMWPKYWNFSSSIRVLNPLTRESWFCYWVQVCSAHPRIDQYILGTRCWDKEGTLFWELVDQEDGRLLAQKKAQKPHLVGAWMPGSFMDQR